MHDRDVLASQRDLLGEEAALLAKSGDEAVAVAGLGIELRGVVRHQLPARVVSEDVRQRVVAFEDVAGHGVAIDAGEIALEEQSMTKLAAAQGRLDAAPADGADQNLAGDAQQRAALVGPYFVFRRADAEDADRHAVVEQRHGDDGTIAGPLVHRALRHRLARAETRCG